MRGGLVDLQWDGELKRSRVPTKLILHQQQKFVQLIFLWQLKSFSKSQFLTYFFQIFSASRSIFFRRCEKVYLYS